MTSKFHTHLRLGPTLTTDMGPAAATTTLPNAAAATAAPPATETASAAPARPQLQTSRGVRPVLSACPVCRGARLHYAVSTGGREGHRVVRCADCRLLMLNPQPSDVELSTVGSEAAYADAITDSAGTAAEDAFDCLCYLARYCGPGGGRLLEITCGPDDGRPSALATEAARFGFRVTRLCLTRGPNPRGRPPVSDERSAPVARIGRGGTVVWPERHDIGAAPLPEEPFDACVLNGALERSRDPVTLLKGVRQWLRPGGVLLGATYTTPVSSAGGTGPRGRGTGPGFRSDVLTYFDPLALESALHAAGYRETIVRPPPPSRGGPMLAAGRPIAAAAVAGQRRTLSVIVPAFNEARTVGPMLDALLAKRVAGMEVEVVVVESNSTDGTRDVVRAYEDDPRVRLVLEDRPRGKGHAVRTGFAHATGDFILIQDADLEYDLEDYDVLLEPLASGREALVLGARHGGNAWWKMRRFNRRRALSLFFNCGHWFFTALLNGLFGQRLRDPFTMYKVFRRDCLFGLEFRCNRFDFDHELLVKLIRKGYRPVEIPVNYRSRSFEEGKKVAAIRDPLTWLVALARLRLERVDPLETIERARAAARAAHAPVGRTSDVAASEDHAAAAADAAVSPWLPLRAAPVADAA
jgi:glycosyltransferase involved in cell wall biosynthesis